ncbi:DUF3218 family protein, partial [Pseudomonas aeruginosa]|uniref:DUF3218 family protein n=1 Tax=Pseudomonas aeruginosa TaxID=287 RepID=UPI0039687F32
MDVNDVVNQAEQINLYQNPGQSISGLYKGLANQCSPGQPFPEAELDSVSMYMSRGRRWTCS